MHTELARDVFERDLQQDPDYIEHKKNAVKQHYRLVYRNKYVDEFGTIYMNSIPISVHFHVVNIASGIGMPTTKELENPLIDIRYKHILKAFNIEEKKPKQRKKTKEEAHRYYLNGKRKRELLKSQGL